MSEALTVAAATTFELARLDALRGPALIGGSATAESLMVATVAAAWMGPGTISPAWIRTDAM